ncbi:MAG: hypothetical protein IIA01_01175 [Proteobacteria bacterium]|nr:hypothetical protein [Pseudomonadota bacterium]
MKIVIVLFVFLVMACATTVADLTESGDRAQTEMPGNYVSISNCMTRWLEHDNPLSGIGAGLGRNVVHRVYPERHEAEVQGFAPNGFALFVVFLRAGRKDHTELDIFSVPYLLPYGSKQIIETVLAGAAQCAS